MAHPITVPRLGWSMEEGTFVQWLKHDGDPIRPGDPLFVLENEKAAEDIEALDEGVLRMVPGGPIAGETVKVGQLLAYLVGEGEAIPTAAPEAVEEARPAMPAVAFASPHVEEPARQWEPACTPRARRVARELGVNPGALRGSGRGGRIRERDVREAAGSATGGRLIPHSSVRKVVAARMVAGVTEAAPVTLTTKVDATNLVGLRGQFQAAVEAADGVPSYTDFIVKLAAITLRRHPRLQAQWRDEGLFEPDCVHVAVAVDTDSGLLVPVVRDADTLTLRQVAETTRALIAQARVGRLTADAMRDATFTVTNLGMFGVDGFTPILNLPQSAILGVGRIVREAVIAAERVVPRDALTLSLTFDHRVVDGAPAARFLDALRRCLEQPAAWLVS